MSTIQNFFIGMFGFYNNWMIWATAILFFFIVLVIMSFVSQNDEYKKFNTFEKYRVIWKWKYEDKKIVSLWCYCPTCNNILSFDDEHNRRGKLGDKNTFFICNHCGGIEKGRAKGGDRTYIMNLLKNEIYRLIEKKEFEPYLKEKKRL